MSELTVPTPAQVVKKDHKSKKVVAKLSRAMTKMGLIGVNKSRLQAFREIGVELEPQVLLQDGRGGALINQQVALDILIDLKRIYDGSSDKAKQRITPLIACAIRALGTANKNIADLTEEEPIRGTKKVEVKHTMVPFNDSYPEKPTTTVEVLPTGQ